MELLFKGIAGALITTILVVILSKQNKEIAIVIIIIACTMIAAAAISYLEPVIQYFEQLKSISGVDSQIYEALVKSVGVALLAEIVSHICTDAGNAALGKVVQLLTTVAIMWLSLPLFAKLMELIENALINL